MPSLALLQKLEGLHTVKTVMDTLGIQRQSALNVICRLKKEQHVTTSGGPRKHLYTITMRKQLPRFPGMFDVLNQHSPHMKLNPWYDHQVHGKYGVEEALVDAVQTHSIRVVLVALRLYNHISDWPKLYRLANEKDCWQIVGALYDVARLFMRVRKMPKRYRGERYEQWKFVTSVKRQNFPDIAMLWKVSIPFNKYDIEGVLNA